MARQRIDAAVKRMSKVRRMLLHFLADIQPEEWFAQPQGVTNLGWQAGHIACAQYALCMSRVRGVRDTDEEVIAPAFLKQYGRGSTPSADPAGNVSPDELLATLERVSARAVEELMATTDEALDEPLEQPHPMFETRLEAVEFCASHELLHIGQVVLLRRLIGREPGF